MFIFILLCKGSVTYSVGKLGLPNISRELGIGILLVDNEVVCVEEPKPAKPVARTLFVTKKIHELGIIDKLPRLAGVETEGANPLYESYKNGWADLKPVTAKKTVASAIRIGNPVSFKKAVRELKLSNGVMEQVSDKEIMDAKAIVDSTGIPICPNSGAAMAGLKKLVDAGTIKKDDKVVCILTAHGAKFSQAIIYYHKSDAKYANKPKSLPATLESVEKSLGLGK